MELLLDLITLLRPRATLSGGIHAVGRWAVSFRERNDVLFCWVKEGECMLARPGSEALRLAQGDFILVRTATPFTLTTDPLVRPVDSETIVESTQNPFLQLGEHTGATSILHGGRFVFDSPNENLLTGLLPSLVHIAGDDASSWRMQSLLRLNNAEHTQPSAASEFIVTRLLELIFVEILRNEISQVNRKSSGLLAGLGDSVTLRAISAMHDNVSEDWSVARLARICGVSRSTFAAHFRKIVGTGPIEYLSRWRIALAKDALRTGKQSIGEIALKVGFQSSSAFSTAFFKAVGCSPSQFRSTDSMPTVS